MIIKIQTIWQGKVGIRDKKINEALYHKEDLEIMSGRDIMIIPWEKIQGKIVGRSEKPFQDRFSKDSHYLIYFNWRPSKNQIKLAL